MSWAEFLPASIFPEALCKTFPRLANRLALCWPDPVLARQFIDTLFHDKRGGRKGFPAPVAAELARLRLHLDTQVSRPRG